MIAEQNFSMGMKGFYMNFTMPLLPFIFQPKKEIGFSLLRVYT